MLTRPFSNRTSTPRRLLPALAQSLAVAAAAGGLLSVQVSAQSVKDLMGKAQEQSERRAVEDLIRKLRQESGIKSSRPKPEAPVAAPSPAPPQEQAAPAEPPKPKIAAPAPTPATPEPPGPPAQSPPAERPPALSPPIEPAPVTEKPATAKPAPRPAPNEPAPAPPPDRAPAELPTTVAKPAPPPAVSTPTPTPPPAVTRQPEIAVADTARLPSVDIEVYFAVGSARITRQAASTLTPLGLALSDKRLASATFLIAGHTDAQGSAEYNQRLSQQRAEAVRRFLIERFKIDGGRLVSRGYGFSRLKLPARPQALENRRVQIVNWTSQVAR